MLEYHTHGFFFYPEEMNDFVPNGPFWAEYVSFCDEDKIILNNCKHKTVSDTGYEIKTLYLYVLIEHLQNNQAHPLRERTPSQ